MPAYTTRSNVEAMCNQRVPREETVWPQSWPTHLFSHLQSSRKMYCVTNSKVLQINQRKTNTNSVRSNEWMLRGMMEGASYAKCEFKSMLAIKGEILPLLKTYGSPRYSFLLDEVSMSIYRFCRDCLRNANPICPPWKMAYRAFALSSVVLTPSFRCP